MCSKEIEIVLNLVQNVSNSGVGDDDGDGGVGGCGVGGLVVVVVGKINKEFRGKNENEETK